MVLGIDGRLMVSSATGGCICKKISRFVNMNNVTMSVKILALFPEVFRLSKRDNATTLFLFCVINLCACGNEMRFDIKSLPLLAQLE